MLGQHRRVLLDLRTDSIRTERRNTMKAPDKSPAILTIHRAPSMTPAGRRAIAKWLLRQADMLVKEGKNYTEGRFTARYLYTKDVP